MIGDGGIGRCDIMSPTWVEVEVEVEVLVAGATSGGR